MDDDFVTNENFDHAPNKLYHLQIGVTYACQCRCEHCGVADQRNRRGMLTVDEIVDLCRQGKEDLDAQVTELFGGEPMVHKRIADIVEGCARYLEVWMSSNGIGFTRERTQELADKGLKRVFFSLDSCYAEKHDANRNFPGSYDTVMRALDYCDEFGIDPNFSTCSMADMVIGGELEELVEFTKRSKANKLRLVLPKMMGRFKGNQDILLRDKEIERIREITAREPIAYVEAEGNYDGRIEKCFCLRGHVYVNPWGAIQPCVYTVMDYGNVRDHSLAFLYRRMHEHTVFEDKSILNLCLLQNPDFVEKYFSDISVAKPLVTVDFDLPED